MKVYVIAGEPSGDALGAALMEGLRTENPQARFAGVGGPGMIAAGLASQFLMEELSIMGLVEVLPKYFHLKRRIRECADAVLADPPDVMITIDSPDFCLRVARLVKAVKPDLLTVHYVAPSVWAWRPERGAKMARVIDHVLALLPFEPELMRKEGMTCDFVGHPIATSPQANSTQIASFRAGLGTEGPVVLALPGSRAGEISRLSAPFGEALKLLLVQHPKARVVVPTVAAQTERVQQAVARWPGNPLVLDPREQSREAAQTEKLAAFGAADVAIAASGTVSLELAAAATPMVIAYDMNWLSRRIIQAKLQIDTVTLVNLVSETRAIPEFIGEACQPKPITQALMDALANPAAQEAAMTQTMEALGRGGEAPGQRAAKSVLARLARTRTS